MKTHSPAAPWLMYSAGKAPRLNYPPSSRLLSSIQDFLHHLWRGERKSPHTLISYYADLLKFLNFYDRIRKPFAQYRKPDFDRFLEDLTLLQPRMSVLPSPNSVRRCSSSLKHFIEYLQPKGLFPDINLKAHIKPPKKRIPDPRYLSRSEVESLVSAIVPGKMNRNGRVLWKSEPDCLTDRLYVRLLFSSGCRISEMGVIRVSDVNFRAMTIQIRGKGDMPRLLKFDSTTELSIKEYSKLKKLGGARYLFFSSSPTLKELNHFEKKVSRRLKICAREAGISPNRISPHVLRHSFATALIEEGAPLTTVQELLGHRSIESTRIYTHISRRKVDEDYGMFHKGV